MAHRLRPREQAVLANGLVLREIAVELNFVSDRAEMPAHHRRGDDQIRDFTTGPVHEALTRSGFGKICDGSSTAPVRQPSRFFALEIVHPFSVLLPSGEYPTVNP